MPEEIGRRKNPPGKSSLGILDIRFERADGARVDRPNRLLIPQEAVGFCAAADLGPPLIGARRPRHNHQVSVVMHALVTLRAQGLSSGEIARRLRCSRSGGSGRSSGRLTATMCQLSMPLGPAIERAWGAVMRAYAYGL